MSKTKQIAVILDCIALIGWTLAGLVVIIRGEVSMPIYVATWFGLIISAFNILFKDLVEDCYGD